MGDVVLYYSYANPTGWVTVSYDNEVKKVVLMVGGYDSREKKVYLTHSEALEIAKAIMEAVGDHLRSGGE